MTTRNKSRLAGAVLRKGLPQSLPASARPSGPRLALPQTPQAVLQCAREHQAAGRIDECVAAYNDFAQLHPRDAEIQTHVGRILQELGAYDAARVFFVRALEIRPDFPEALANLGALLMDLGELDLAEATLRRAIAGEPAHFGAYCNLGSVLGRKGRPAEAIAALQHVLTQQPTHANALCNLGFLLDTLGDSSGAAACFQLALQSQPDHVAARFNLSPHLLLEGRFPDGWRDYELRWQVRQFSGKPPETSAPRWRGEALTPGARILLCAEQGLGDTLQFCRYALLLAEQGHEITLQVQPPLLALLRDLHPRVHVVPAGERLPEGADFDWYCPLMSLPGAFGTGLDTIPAEHSYLRVDPAHVELWRDRIAGPGLRVGVVWSGNPGHARDALRSIPWAQFRSVLDAPGVRFFSLQKGPAEHVFQGASAPTGLTNLAPFLDDFTDTAAAILHLDLVLAVDTSVAHLAGALGKSAWLLVPFAPDWRWLRDRVDSPWYPSMRLFRQPAAGQWEAVLARVRAELKALT